MVGIQEENSSTSGIYGRIMEDKRLLLAGSVPGFGSIINVGNTKKLCIQKLNIYLTALQLGRVRFDKDGFSSGAEECRARE